MATDEFARGIELFNDEEFFECHEVLESAWNKQPEPEKILTQGIIQVAVAYYHVRRQNFVGAEKLVLRALPRIEQFVGAPDARVDVQQLLGCAREALAAIQSGRTPPAFKISFLAPR